jgi:hypothetical protein
VIADKFVDLYARNSGLGDKLVAERDVGGKNKYLAEQLRAEIRSLIGPKGRPPSGSSLHVDLAKSGRASIP